MDRAKMKIIECEGFQIAATVETNSTDEHPIYYPANYLIYVEQGELNLKIENQVYTIKEGEFVFVRKYTHGIFFKRWKEDQKVFREHIFVLHDAFIKEVIREFEMPGDFMPCTVPMIRFTDAPILKGLMKSLQEYITGQARLDRRLIRLKTMEALHGLTALKPELIHVFNEFSEPARADLVKFMENNYTLNLSLNQFAELSGRSLSTFNRDFRKTFNLSPHKWIKQRRLELAKKLLLQTAKKASDIYLDVGFEDLAHFSRSFKSHFGQNPSEVKVVAGVSTT